MKIVHIGYSHRCEDTRIFYKECRSLANAGYEVVYITADRSGNRKEYVKDNVRIRPIAATAKGRLKRVTKYLADCYHVAAQENGDVYHIHEPLLLGVGSRLRTNKRCILIYDSHEDSPRQRLQTDVPENFIKRIVRRTSAFMLEVWEDYHAKRVDAIVTATEHIAERFSKIHSMTRCINNYAVLHEKSLNEDRNTNWVCHAGGISEMNRITQVIESLEGTSIRLQLFGEVPSGYRQELERLAGWTNVDEHGWVDSEEIRKVSIRCVAGICMFLPGGNATFSKPVKLFEYMEAGIPVVVPDYGQTKEIVNENDCGVCVGQHDPGSMRRALQSLVADPDRVRTLGQNGRAAVENKFNWGIEEKKLLSLYESLLRRACPGRFRQTRRGISSG